MSTTMNGLSTPPALNRSPELFRALQTVRGELGMPRLTTNTIGLPCDDPADASFSGRHYVSAGAMLALLDLVPTMMEPADMALGRGHILHRSVDHILTMVAAWPALMTDTDDDGQDTPSSLALWLEQARLTLADLAYSRGGRPIDPELPAGQTCLLGCCHAA